MRVAIYCCVSTTAGQSVEMQLRDLRQLAKVGGGLSTKKSLPRLGVRGQSLAIEL
jgi:hypothetical protein